MVRIVREDDILIHQASDIEETIFPHPYTFKDMKSIAVDKNNLLLIDEEDGIVYGYLLLSITMDFMDVYTCGVRPDMQGRGIGRELFLTCFQYMKDNEINEIFLEARANNERALNLYKGLGFVQISIRERYYSDPIEDAIVMKKYLEK